jgi:phosphatidate cytidylyltransferase
MRTRAITGFFFVIVMIGSTLLGHTVYDSFYLLLSGLCLWEFYDLLKKSGAAPARILGILSGAVLYLIATFITDLNSIDYNSLFPFFIILVPLISLIFILELYKKSTQPFMNIAYTLLGIVFTILPFSFFHALAYLPTRINMYNGFNFHIPLGFLIMLWANDTGAYLCGMSFGRHKLFERHSPKKTWEGFIGGVLISAGAGLILSHFYKELAWMHWVIAAILIGCFGTLGDLVESMFKRSINVKDSGGILPGHGGLLDRFDGLLMAAPIVYMYLYFVTN